MISDECDDGMLLLGDELAGTLAGWFAQPRAQVIPWCCRRRLELLETADQGTKKTARPEGLALRTNQDLGSQELLAN